MRTPILLISICAALVGARPAGSQEASPRDPSHVPAGAASLPASGVPLGGIGAGSFELRADGSVSRATYNNNWARPMGRLPGCFAALWVRAGDRTTARVVALHSDYGLPAVKAIDYDGVFPQALLSVKDEGLTVGATLRAFSPLVPFDLKSSAYPAAAYIFTLRNPLPYKIEVAAALSWENTLGVGATLAGESFADRTGDCVQPAAEAAGFASLTFTGGPLHDPASDRDAAGGNMTLSVNASQADAHPSAAGWDALSPRPQWWDEFARDGTVSGAAPIGREGSNHPAGVVALRLTLQPRSFVRIPFVIAWYTPQLSTPRAGLLGHYYATIYHNSGEVARRLLTDWRALLALTLEPQQRLLTSDLPAWVSRRIINSLTPFATNTLLTQDGRFAWLGTIGEGTPHPLSLASGGERLAAASALLCYFPSLETAALVDLTERAQTTGLLPSRTLLADLAPASASAGQRSSVPGPKAAPPHLSVEDVEAVAGAALELAQIVATAGGAEAYNRVTAGVDRAIAAVVARCDTDGLPVIDSQGQVGVARVTRLRASTAVLWLAALRAEARLRSESDAGRARFEEAAVRARAGILRRYWNGTYLSDSTDPAAAGICASDQLLGQWIADRIGLGDLLGPRETSSVTAALQHLEEAGNAADPFGPPWRSRPPGSSNETDATVHLAPAVLGEAALYLERGQANAALTLLARLSAAANGLNCGPWRTEGTWDARSGLTDEPGASAIDQAADWDDLAALHGFQMDASAGALTLRPSMPGVWRRFEAPIFSAMFWGSVQYRPLAHGGVFTLRIDRLPLPGDRGVRRLTLQTLRLPGAPPVPGARPPDVYVTVTRLPISPHTIALTAEECSLSFDPPLNLAAGDTVEVDIH